MKHSNVVIIGAGPTGLGAAHRLQELGEKDFLLLEARENVGGLAASYEDDQGFWWDIGGHVQFSHYQYFDQLMDTLLVDNWLTHQRESWVWIANRFVPYPFQLNIHRLPKKMMVKCLEGIIDLSVSSPYRQPNNFAEWIRKTAGTGIANYFLLPYNQKVWAYPPEMLNTAWVGERVVVTDLKRVIYNVLYKRDDRSWGPNNTFRFPTYGGTGAIWNALADTIEKKSFQCLTKVIAINTKKKILTVQSGSQIAYGALISTIPLDLLVGMSDLSQDVKKIARGLKHSSTHVIGIGVQGTPSEDLRTKCWMYFPENNAPFYRVTLFSRYSPYNVPDSTKYFSLMAEVSSSSHKMVNRRTLIQDVIAGLLATRLLQARDIIVSQWVHEELYGYPTPSLQRDEIVSRVQPVLMERDIYSRGRFGMWKYEVSNQDHSLMQGVEAVNNIIRGEEEVTAWHPEVVNGVRGG